MKKCLLISYYESDNLGDIAIGEKYYSDLSPYYVVKKYNLSGMSGKTKSKSNNNFKSLIIDILYKIGLGFAYTIYKKNKLKKNIKKELEKIDFDFVVFGGGNLLFETSIHSQYIQNVKQICKYLNKKNKTYIFSSIGVGPFYTKKQLVDAQVLVKNSSYSSFRDEKSIDALEIIWKNENKINLTVDPILSYNLENYKTTNDNYILLNFVDFRLFQSSVSFEDVLKKCVNIVSSFLMQTNKKVILFSSDLADKPFLQEIMNAFSTDSFNRLTIFFPESVDSLVRLLSGATFVIASRMHSLIFSFLLNKKIIALNWNPKVEAFMGLINRSKMCFSLEDFSFEDFLSTDKEDLTDQEELLFHFREEREHEIQRIVNSVRNYTK